MLVLTFLENILVCRKCILYGEKKGKMKVRQNVKYRCCPARKAADFMHVPAQLLRMLPKVRLVRACVLQICIGNFWLLHKRNKEDAHKLGHQLFREKAVNHEWISTEKKHSAKMGKNWKRIFGR